MKKNWLTNNFLLKITSLALAILTWAYVHNTVINLTP